ALQATAFSKNQKYFSYAVSASGSDWQEIAIMDFASRKLLDEKIEHVKFTSISWKGEEGFYYSGYDKPKDEKTKYSAKTEYRKIFFHKIGTPQSQDELIYEDKQHPLRYVGAGLTEDDRFLILSIAERTDGTEIKVQDLSKQSASFVTIVTGFKTNANVVSNVGDKILLQTNQDAPNGKIVLLDPTKPDAASWITIVPEKTEALEAVSTGGGKLFCSYLKDVTTQVLQYDMDG